MLPSPVSTAPLVKLGEPSDWMLWGTLPELVQVHVTVPPTDPEPQFPHRWRYARGSLPTNNAASSTAWHCVYPGPYDYLNRGNPDPKTFPLLGWKLTILNPAANPQPQPLKVGLGLRKGKNGTDPGATYDTRPLQVANRDAAGPNTFSVTGVSGD